MPKIYTEIWIKLLTICYKSYGGKHMNIGIIIHSQTGNTRTVAQKLHEKLTAAGHMVSIENVVAANDKESDVQKVRLTAKPDVSRYDALLFGSPVHGFSLSPVMQAYLASIGLLHGKKVGCFMTQFFPYAWMGGNRALCQLCGMMKTKGANVYGSGIVHWSRAASRDDQIHAVTLKLSADLIVNEQQHGTQRA